MQTNSTLVEEIIQKLNTRIGALEANANYFVEINTDQNTYKVSEAGEMRSIPNNFVPVYWVHKLPYKCFTEEDSQLQKVGKLVNVFIETSNPTPVNDLIANLNISSAFEKFVNNVVFQKKHPIVGNSFELKPNDDWTEMYVDSNMFNHGFWSHEGVYDDISFKIAFSEATYPTVPVEH